MECITPEPNSKSLCSGNGYICSVPDIGCICNSGWTSLGDFSLGSEGAECLINYTTIRAMSYFCVVIPMICNILIIRHYISLAMRKKSIYVITHEYKTQFPLCFLILGFSCSTLGILKVAYPDEQQPLIGRDLSVSLVTFIALSFALHGAVLYLHVIIKFLQGYSRMMTLASRDKILMQLNILGFYSWFISPATVIIAVLPLIAIAHPSQSKELCMAHLIGMAALSSVYAAIFSRCISFLVKELKIYTQNIEGTVSKDLLLVIKRLSMANIAFTGTAFLVGLIYLVFGCSNFMFHLMSYSQIFIFTAVPPVMFVAVITVALVSRPDSSRVLPGTPAVSSKIYANADTKTDDC